MVEPGLEKTGGVGFARALRDVQPCVLDVAQRHLFLDLITQVKTFYNPPCFAKRNFFESLGTTYQ